MHLHLNKVKIKFISTIIKLYKSQILILSILINLII